MKRFILFFLTLICFVLIAACTNAHPETEDNSEQDDVAARIVDIYAVIDALRNPDEWVVIDVRTAEEFNGESRLPNAFGSGRIRGAINVDRWSVTGAGDAVLSREELMEMFGFIGDRNVIVYCHGGVRSGFVQFVLTDLGFYTLNYLGSWIDWSRAASVAGGGANDVVLSFTEAWIDNEGEI